MSHSKHKFNYIICHFPCTDGLVSSWIYLRYIDTEHKAKYLGIGASDPMPAEDYKDSTVLFLDVCPSREELESLIGVAKLVVILDHHASSKKKVAGLIANNLEIIIADDRAGCQVTWDYFQPLGDKPWFIDYVADRDIWTWTQKNSAAINKYCFTEGYLSDYTGLNKLLLFSKDDFTKAIAEGNAMIKNEQQIIQKHVKYAQRYTFLEKYTVRVVSASVLISEIGHAICAQYTDCDFAAVYEYWLDEDIYHVHCRATRTDIDLSKILEPVGGGGHEHAAAFKVFGKLNHVFKAEKIATLSAIREIFPEYYQLLMYLRHNVSPDKITIDGFVDGTMICKYFKWPSQKLKEIIWIARPRIIAEHHITIADNLLRADTGHSIKKVDESEILGEYKAQPGDKGYIISDEKASIVEDLNPNHNNNCVNFYATRATKGRVIIVDMFDLRLAKKKIYTKDRSVYFVRDSIPARSLSFG